MKEKAERKVPGYTDVVFRIVGLLDQLPIDARIDLFGMNKLSLYPQVCAYGTTLDQLEKHCQPLDCRFNSGSTLDLRRTFERKEMYIYMRYLYMRLFFQSYGYYPGKVKPGAEDKHWHIFYRVRGVPSDNWRESDDIDLRGSMQVPIPDFDTYLGLADSACAPSDPKSYASMQAYQDAPMYEKRKLLYLLKHPKLPDIKEAYDKMRAVGDAMAPGCVAHQPIDVGFSLDISTGMRFERQKPAARPFYQLSAPFGCLASTWELVVRHWLRHVPQSLMSMSLKDRGESALRINSALYDLLQRFLVSDDKEGYSPGMDPESQALTSEFFAEVTDDNSIKAITNTLLTNELYYRVHGRLVHYPSNGTDREGLRGAQNTWTEIVCHGYHTRCLRESGTYEGVTAFIGFIDDALRRYEKEVSVDELTVDRVRFIVSDLEEKLRVLGRKLSWDKAYVSETLSTILGEVFYAGLPMKNGSKSFVSFGEVDKKLVEDASSMEGNYASKCIGAKTAGANDAAAYYAYVHMTMKEHHKMGVRVDARMNEVEYVLWCLTPIALGGAGLRGPLELNGTETGSRIAAGIGNLCRIAAEEPKLTEPLNAVLNNDLELLSDMDFLRDPTQVHVTGPRIRTQRMNQHVRMHMSEYATSPHMKTILKEADACAPRLIQFAKHMRKFQKVDVQEVKAYYAGSAQHSIDALVTKICSSDTVKSLVAMDEVSKLRKSVKSDTVQCSVAYRYRMLGIDIPSWISDL
jgi:hypothetical protein